MSNICICSDITDKRQRKNQNKLNNTLKMFKWQTKWNNYVSVSKEETRWTLMFCVSWTRNSTGKLKQSRQASSTTQLESTARQRGIHISLPTISNICDQSSALKPSAGPAATLLIGTPKPLFHLLAQGPLRHNALCSQRFRSVEDFVNH